MLRSDARSGRARDFRRPRAAKAEADIGKDGFNRIGFIGQQMVLALRDRLFGLLHN